MSDIVEARIHPLRKEGDTEVVSLKVPEGSLGGGSAPVYARASWNYDDPNVMPNDTLSLEDRDQTNSFFVGCEIDADDPTRLNFPSGVYLMSAMFSLNAGSTDPTYFLAGINPGFDGDDGLVPDSVYATTGPDSGSTSPTGQPLDPSIDFLQVQWSGLANVPFYVTFVINHDSPDMEGYVDFRLTRVAVI
jgi:hypothetical protein